MLAHARRATVLVGLLTSEVQEANDRVPGRSRELHERLRALERSADRQYGVILGIVIGAADSGREPALISPRVEALQLILESAADECEHALRAIADRLAVAQEFCAATFES